LVYLIHLACLIELAERGELGRGRLLIDMIHLIHRADVVDLLHGRAVVHATLNRCCRYVRGGDMLLIATSRVRIVVYS
jgi:hypothetical protein